MLAAFGRPYLESKNESTYRESVFLQHDKVPLPVKSSVSPEINAKLYLKNVSNIKNITTDVPNIISAKIRTNETLSNFKVIRLRNLITSGDII